MHFTVYGSSMPGPSAGWKTSIDGLIDVLVAANPIDDEWAEWLDQNFL